MQQLTILGSTGSVGKSTLEVVRTNREQFAVLALTADSNVAEMLRQCLLFQPQYVAMLSQEAAQQLRVRLREHGSTTEVFTGVEAICHLAALPQADQVVAAIAGTAGLLPTLAAVQAGKRLLLANKESLVTCGALFMAAVESSGTQLLPIDSEHNAIFQCLPPEVQQRAGGAVLEQYDIQRIILTASGGPFHRTALVDLKNVSPEQACAHPNWSMGRKISVDSATMMNKGLEYIEARWLFNASAKQLEVVVHPQSVIHSMVQFTDGGLLAQCSQTDMRIPISYALAYPRRIPNGATALDLNYMSQLTFETVDDRRYPCLPLAITACASGQAATTVLNAANEVAVAAFLQRRLSFTAIAHINEETLAQLQPPEPSSVDAVLRIDQQARQVAQRLVLHRGSVCS